MKAITKNSIDRLMRKEFKRLDRRLGVHRAASGYSVFQIGQRIEIWADYPPGLSWEMAGRYGEYLQRNGITNSVDRYRVLVGD